MTAQNNSDNSINSATDNPKTVAAKSERVEPEPIRLAPLEHTGGPTRIVYMGSPQMAVPQLHALVEAGHDVALVITNPDRRRGRGSKTTPTPVKAAATELGIAVSHNPNDSLKVNADLGVVVAYGQLLKRNLLEALPMVNLHFSLLPRWRGAAPVERAILEGDTHTGVCLMRIVKELDAGAVYAKSEVAVGEKTLTELGTELVDISTQLLLETLEEGFGQPVEQSGEVTYAKKLQAKDFVLDLNRSAEELHRIVRLGRSNTTIRSRRLRVLEASYDNTETSLKPGEHDGVHIGTGSGSLILEKVQPEGKKAVDAQAWLNGARLSNSDRFGVT